jgi:hypothetical protein
MLHIVGKLWIRAINLLESSLQLEVFKKVVMGF